MTTLLLGLLAACAAPLQGETPRTALAPCPSLGEGVLCGTHEVWENREAEEGLRLGLDVVVLKATGEEPSDEPLFVIAGGPGMAVTRQASMWVDELLRVDRDIVLVDQRGTAGNHLLACGSDDPTTALDPLFDPERVAACRERFEQTHDLTRYTTPIAMDDLDEVRAALGYGRIHLLGGSYGTRASLVYLRRHPEHVATVTLDGVAPLSFTNPLFHAISAQEGLDLLFDQCAADPACSAAFPDLRAEFAAVLARLDEGPVQVELMDVSSGEMVQIDLDRFAFAESLRILTYTSAWGRRVPSLIHRAAAGDFREFTSVAIQTQHALRSSLSLGMLLCVTCTEDIARIDPETIGEWTDATYLGPGRVHTQMEACAFWPKGRIPEDFGEPVVSDRPVLLLSGTLDPVTPPRWGEAAAEHLENSLHLVVPGGHGVRGPCVNTIVRAFQAAGTVEGLDIGCTALITLPPFVVD